MKTILLSPMVETIVDDDDYEQLNQFKWSHKNGYVIRKINDGPNKQKQIYMHRVIMKTEDSDDCDHIDGNGLNNQKQNLRNCPHRINNQNRRKIKQTSSVYKGVGWYVPARGTPRWRSGIRINGRLINLGNYNLETDAAIAYNIAAKFYFKEFANLNIIEGVTECDYSRIVTKLSGKLNETYLK